MKQYLTDILPLLFLILVFWRAEIHIPDSRGESLVLVSRGNGRALRGIAAAVVVLHHIAPTIRSGFLLKHFSGTGSLAVALFFCLSGYGLQKQYMLRGKDYCRGFLNRRVPRVLIPYLMAVFCCWLVYALMGKVFSLREVFAGLRYGSEFLPYSWYILAILLFYFVFWFLMLSCGEHYGRMVVAASGWAGLYVFLCICLKYGSWWYDTVHMLPFGMFVAVYEERILTWLLKKKLRLPLTAGIITCLFLLWSAFMLLFPPNGLKAIYLYSAFRVFLSTAMVLAIQLMVRIGNPALNMLGDLSLEIYLCHGMLQYLLRGDRFYLGNDAVFTLLMLGSVLLFSSLFHVLAERMIRLWERITRFGRKADT